MGEKISKTLLGNGRRKFEGIINVKNLQTQAGLVEEKIDKSGSISQLQKMC